LECGEASPLWHGARSRPQKQFKGGDASLHSKKNGDASPHSKKAHGVF
jgi:hypothetical protein